MAKPLNGSNGKSPNGSNGPRVQGEAFKRVDDSYWSAQIKNDKLKDNSCKGLGLEEGLE